MTIDGHKPYKQQSNRLLFTLLLSTLLFCSGYGFFDHLHLGVHPIRYVDPTEVNPIVFQLLTRDLVSFYFRFSIELLFIIFCFTISYSVTYSANTAHKDLTIDHYIYFFRVSRTVISSDDVVNVFIQKSSRAPLILINPNRYRIAITLTKGTTLPLTSWSYSTKKDALSKAQEISTFFNCDLSLDTLVDDSSATRVSKFLMMFVLLVSAVCVFSFYLKDSHRKSNNKLAKALWNHSVSHSIPGGTLETGAWTHTSHAGNDSKGAFTAWTESAPCTLLKLEWYSTFDDDLEFVAKRVFLSTKQFSKLKQTRLASNITIETTSPHPGCGPYYRKCLSCDVLSGTDKVKIGQVHHWYCTTTKRTFLLICIQSLGPHAHLNKYSRELACKTKPCHCKPIRITNGSS